MSPLCKHGEVTVYCPSCARAESAERIAQLEAALRQCVEAMENVTIFGDGRLDDATRREFSIAFDAARAVLP